MKYAGILILAVSAWAADSARILIVTDMEGVGGVNNAQEQLLPGQRRFDESRRLLTGEVNAAVEGALDAGANEIVVWDGHDSSRSLAIDTIHPRAHLIQGVPTPPDYYMKDRLYDGIFFVGQHAMAGAPNAILAHSQSFTVQNLSMNGRNVGEIGQVAAIGGYFHIPVIFLSGDQAACDEVLALQPKAETVAVKRLAGKGSSLSLSHEEAKARIRAGARRAVERIHEFSPWIVEGPVELKFEYGPGATTPSEPRTLVYKGQTVLEAYQQWMKR
jgi:D-amino peptidase